MKNWLSKTGVKVGAIGLGLAAAAGIIGLGNRITDELEFMEYEEERRKKYEDEIREEEEYEDDEDDEDEG